jgi:hypothetical protein
MMSVFIGFSKVAAVPSISTHEKNCYEYLMPFYRLMVVVNRIPDLFKRLLAWVLNKFTNE